MDLKNKTTEELISIIDDTSLSDEEIKRNNYQNDLLVVEVIRCCIFNLKTIDDEWFGWIHLYRSLTNKNLYMLVAYNVMKGKKGSRVYKNTDHAINSLLVNKYITTMHIPKKINARVTLIHDGELLYG